MSTNYLQVFSMTDHAKALHERYQGDYLGLNSQLQTSEMKGSELHVAVQTLSQTGELDRVVVESAQVIVAYRHSDTGELRGTSEMLIPISKLPWTDMPGFEVLKILPKGGLKLKLWSQEVTLQPDRVLRIHFGKTIVYLRCYGGIDGIVWAEHTLTHGPSTLHAETIDEDLTLAAGSGSALTVKMGQETQT